MNNPKRPHTGKKPETPKLPARDIGSGLFYDAFELPAFITASDKKEFYYRFSKEDRMQMLTRMGYKQVVDPDSKKSYRMSTKDSESDLILVKQPMQYHLEDLKMKQNRVKGAIPELKIPKGLEIDKSYVPED